VRQARILNEKNRIDKIVFFMKAIVGAAMLLALSLVLFSDFWITPLGGYASQRFLLSFIPGLLIPCLFLSYARYLPVPLAAVVIASMPTLLLCAAFIVLSLPYQNDLYAWVEPGMYVFYFFTIFFAGAMLAWFGSALEYTRFLVVVIALACTVYGLATISVYLFAVFDGVTDLVGFIPWGFANIRYWSHIATWCLPLIPLAILTGPVRGHRLWRLFVLLGAGLWWWILFMSSSRGSMLSIVFGVVLVMVLLGRTAYPWAKVLLKHLLVGIALWVLLSLVIPSLILGELQVRSIKTDSSGRMPLFIEAWHMSLQNFPFGMGPQSWLTHDVITSTYANSKKFGHPHNMYLMWAAEYGWILVMALAGLVVQAIRSFWRVRVVYGRDEGSTRALLLAGYTASVSAALLHAGVSAVFMAPGSMLVGLLVLVGFWALIQPGMQVVDRGGAVDHRLGLSKKCQLLAMLVLFAIAIGWLAWFKEVWVYYEDMRLDEEYYYSEVGEGVLPRFWFHGNFPREVLASGSQELNEAP